MVIPAYGLLCGHTEDPSQVPARIPSWGRSCMQDEGLGGVPVHLPMVTAHGTALRVPYMKSLRGSPLGWYCSSVIHHKHTHLLGLLLGPSCGGTSRVSLRCFLGAACRMRFLDITDHLTLVMSYGVSLRVPYMKSLRGSLGVVLSCIIVLLLFYHKHTSP